MRKIRLAGIYKILHLPTGLFYIGYSSDVFTRWANHYMDCRQLKHSSTEFQTLLLTTSIEEFTFNIIEYCSIQNYRKISALKGKPLELGFKKYLLEREQFHMSNHLIEFSLNKNKKHFKDLSN